MLRPSSVTGSCHDWSRTWWAPLAELETLTDRPTQRYSTGILYPTGSRIEPEEDQDRGLAVNVIEDAASDPEIAGVPLHAALKPSVAGMSFAVEPDGSDIRATVEFRLIAQHTSVLRLTILGKRPPGLPPTDPMSVGGEFRFRHQNTSSFTLEKPKWISVHTV